MNSKNTFLLLERHSKFNNYNEHDKNAIVNLIVSKIHSKFSEHPNDKNSLTIIASYIRPLFTKRDIYKTVLNDFFVLLNPSYRAGNYSRQYDFESELKNLLLEVKNYKPTYLLNDSGNKIKTVPKNTILQKDINGKNKTINIEIENYVRINAEQLDKLIMLAYDAIQQNRPELFNALNPKKDKSIKEIESTLMYLNEVKRTSINDISNEPGLIAQYKQVSSCRLCGVGALHPQTIETHIRKVLFSGFDWHDYDIVNCHYTILFQIYNNMKVIVNNKNITKAKSKDYYKTYFKIPDSKLPTINEYLNNAYLFREKISDECSIDYENAKKLLISLIYGAQLTKYHSIWINICAEDLNIFNAIKNSATVKRLMNELKIASEFILKHSEVVNIRGEYKLKNLAGGFITIKKSKEYLEKNPNDKTKYKNKRQQLSHILQGVEAKCLESACNALDGSVKILMHDGFVTNKKININELSDAIQRDMKELGFNLQFQFKENALNFDIDEIMNYKMVV